MYLNLLFFWQHNYKPLFNFSHQVCSSQGLLQRLIWSLELGSTVATEEGKLIKYSVVTKIRKICLIFKYFDSIRDRQIFYLVDLRSLLLMNSVTPEADYFNRLSAISTNHTQIVLCLQAVDCDVLPCRHCCGWERGYCIIFRITFLNEFILLAV